MVQWQPRRCPTWCECEGWLVWAQGMASLYATVNKAMADVEDSQQRRAARSMVALAFHRWGCREDPNTWDFRYLREALQSKLDEPRARVRYVGDAFMLAMLLFDGAAMQADKHDAEGRRRQELQGWWQFREARGAGHPLRPTVSSA